MFTTFLEQILSVRLLLKSKQKNNFNNGFKLELGIIYRLRFIV